jgi:hypothetical protein
VEKRNAYALSAPYGAQLEYDDGCSQDRSLPHDAALSTAPFAFIDLMGASYGQLARAGRARSRTGQWGGPKIQHRQHRNIANFPSPKI